MKLKALNGHSRILLILVSFILLFSIIFFVVLQRGVNAKEAELEALNNELQQIQEDNSAISYLINDADEAELFEHLARERGYVYPDEKIYYNVTPGN